MNHKPAISGLFHKIVHLLLLALLLVTFSAGNSHPANATNAPVSSVIVQGQDIQNVVAAVREVGGTVTHELSVINGVGASLTTTQIALLEKEYDLRIYNNQSVQTQQTTTSETVRDEFNSNTFNGNDGSVYWASDWTEDDPQSGGVAENSGAVRVKSNQLRLDDNPDTGGYPSAARRVDLSGVTSATFSFDYSTSSGVDSSDAVAVEVSSDGITFTVLESLTGISGTSSGSKSYDILGYASADTTIRFRVTSYYGGGNEYFYADDIEVAYTLDGSPSSSADPPPKIGALWVTTETTVAGQSGAMGMPNEGWAGGEMLEFWDPELSFEASDTTYGNFSREFNLDDFAVDGDARVDALHYVSNDIVVGTNNIQLLAGDLLLSTVFTEDLTNGDGSNFREYSSEVFIFRPDEADDYSAGNFYRLMKTWDIGLNDISAITLIEEDVVVGDAQLTAGNFLLTHRGDRRKVFYYEPGNLGDATTTGTVSLFLDGHDVGINSGYNEIVGLELIESDMIIADTAFAAGQVLMTLYGADNVGSNNLWTNPQDIFMLDVEQTGSNTVATAALFFEGDDVGLDSWQESPWGIALKNAGTYDTGFPTLVEADTLHEQGIDGSAVTIAVLDTGHWSHPGLNKGIHGQERLLAQYDAIADEVVTIGTSNDNNGHGTHVTQSCTQ